MEEGWEAARVKFDCVKKDLLQDLISMELMKDDKLVGVASPGLCGGYELVTQQAAHGH